MAHTAAPAYLFLRLADLRATGPRSMDDLEVKALAIVGVMTSLGAWIRTSFNLKARLWPDWMDMLGMFSLRLNIPLI